MSKVGIERIVSDVSNELQAILKRANLIDGYLNRVVYRQYQNIQRERWASENATEGNPWPSLNAKYAQYKARKYASYPGGGTKMMIRTKRLFNSVVGDDLQEHKKIIDDHELQIYSSVPYAQYANERRNFTEFSKGTMREIMSGITNYLAGSKV